MRLPDARVLVVDDEPELCAMFAKWLRARGCRDVRTAPDGAVALELIGERPVDVLITDIRMPVMDGLSLVRRLAAMNSQTACILFVSGFGDLEACEMYDLGVRMFLAKPFRLEELLAAVEQAIADVSSLWKTPMPSSPRQSVLFEGVEIAASSPMPCATESGFLLGRGGFSIRTVQFLRLGEAAFRCTFPHAPELAGQGFVRWRSRATGAVGIEFAFLESPGREWVARLIERENPRSFIPAL